MKSKGAYLLSFYHLNETNEIQFDERIVMVSIKKADKWLRKCGYFPRVDILPSEVINIKPAFKDKYYDNYVDKTHRNSVFICKVSLLYDKNDIQRLNKK